MHSIAFEIGKEAGRITRCAGHACPFSHENLEDRMAWFDGFAAGRADYGCPSPQSPIKKVRHEGATFLGPATPSILRSFLVK